ncbi:hypothetical protein C9F11_12375 [Streptomyces sp. YIM 121038]|nr:hypothetical protein C9F11_12375 [Streptomyces sp. YIM 121038]
MTAPPDAEVPLDVPLDALAHLRGQGQGWTAAPLS